MSKISSTAATPTPAEFRTMIEGAQKANEELASQAPSAIKSDVTLVVNASTGFYKALADANYDITKISSSTLTQAEDAMAAPAVKAAAARIRTYVKDTCGITLVVPGSGQTNS